MSRQPASPDWPKEAAYEFDTIAMEFSAYINSSSVAVQTLEDTLDEDDESFELRLVAASEDLNIGISSARRSSPSATTMSRSRSGGRPDHPRFWTGGGLLLSR